MRKVLIPLTMAAALLVGGCGGGSRSSSTAAGAAPAATTSAVTGAASSPASGAGAGSSSSGAGTGAGTGTGATACPTSNTTAFAKTKFVTHTGLAFGAFHRYLYKPYRAGTFTSGGTKSKVLAFAKAGAAALFVKREVRLASEDVKANPTLCKAIAAPLASLSDSISGAVTKLKSGDASGITAANSAIAGIESSAGQGGAPITEDQNAKIS